LQQEAADKEAEEVRRAKRSQICAEIVSTEQSYLVQLATLEELYIKPLRAQPMILSIKHSDLLFANIMSLREMNLGLLQEFEAHLASDEQCFGKALVEFAPYFAMYRDYAKCHSEAVGLLKKLDETSRVFREFCLLASNDQKANNLSLTSLLITPIQRYDIHTHTRRSHTNTHARTQGNMQTTYDVRCAIGDTVTIYDPYTAHTHDKVVHTRTCMRTRTHKYTHEQTCAYIRRVPRYLLLLRELETFTPDDHPDKAGIAEALELVGHALADVNKAVRAPYEGRLKKKKSGISKKWKMHFFWLCDGELSYSENESRKNAKGLLQVNAARVVCFSDKVFNKNLGRVGFQFGITPSTAALGEDSTRMYIMEAESEKARAAWVELLIVHGAHDDGEMDEMKMTESVKEGPLLLKGTGVLGRTIWTERYIVLLQSNLQIFKEKPHSLKVCHNRYHILTSPKHHIFTS
jgi:hypothetical protein